MLASRGIDYGAAQVERLFDAEIYMQYDALHTVCRSNPGALNHGFAAVARLVRLAGYVDGDRQCALSLLLQSRHAPDVSFSSSQFGALWALERSLLRRPAFVLLLERAPRALNRNSRFLGALLRDAGTSAAVRESLSLRRDWQDALNLAGLAGGLVMHVGGRQSELQGGYPRSQ